MRAHIYIQGGRMGSSRRAHHMLSSGLPSGGEWAATSPLFKHMSKQLMGKGEGATSINKGLPPQEGATSPRGAHLSSHICSYLSRYAINHYLVPFDSLIDFAFNSSPNLSPLYSFFYFHLADFIELKCTFWVFEGKITF